MDVTYVSLWDQRCARRSSYGRSWGYKVRGMTDGATRPNLCIRSSRQGAAMYDAIART